MRVFVDIPVIPAGMNVDDGFQATGSAGWRQKVQDRPQVNTSGDVVGKTVALLHRRPRLDAPRSLHPTPHPITQVMWVAQKINQAALRALLNANRRLSPVDCTACAITRPLGQPSTLTFDPHGPEQPSGASPARRRRVR
jgi:hypothetical protein